MEYVSIKSRDDLRMEILRLQGVSAEQGKAIGAHFSSPGAIFATIFSLFSNKSHDVDEKDGGIMSQDFVGLISRFILPMVLNKTIFRNSNFIVKALVGLVSQKASHFISEESIEGLWHKVSSAFEGGTGDIWDKVTSIFQGDKKKKAKTTNHPSKHI